LPDFSELYLLGGFPFVVWVMGDLRVSREMGRFKTIKDQIFKHDYVSHLTNTIKPSYNGRTRKPTENLQYIIDEAQLNVLK